MVKKFLSREEETFISIDELIARAKNLGIDFGRGDPKNRLRYFVKIGLFPHAQRKSYNGLPSQGVYPVSALKTLLEIDKKLKEGKSVLQIKRELGKESKESENFVFSENLPDRNPPTLCTEERAIFVTENVKKQFFDFNLFKKSFFLLFLFSTIFFLKEKINFQKPLTMFLGTIENFRKIAQLPITEERRRSETISQFFLEPFLTINAETLLNSRLTVKESVFSPSFVITSEGFAATIATLPLTSNQTYTFPDQSGVVCLSTGNCFGLAGEIFSTGGITNRLAKFTGSRRIENSSLVDLFAGISITIDRSGNVGIGRENPLYKLHVQGDTRIEGLITASGDVCTDLGGRKCLSQISITPTPPRVYVVGRGAGVGGSGNINYLPLWVGGTTLGNSLLYQTDGKIGINLTNPNELLTIGGVISLIKTTEPEGTTGFGKIFVGTDGNLYYKNEAGAVFNLTFATGNVSGFGRSGQVAFWTATTSLGGSDDFFWDVNQGSLGIGTATPTEKLEVVGTVKMTGFQLTTDPALGYVLTSDALGRGYWRPAPTGTIPSGLLSGETLRYNGLGWVPSDFLINTDSFIGIGTTSQLATLTVAGSGFFNGPLTINTLFSPQLVLQYDNNHYLNFSISSTSSQIFSTDNLVFNSLSGEIKFFDTSLKRGDKILRASIPIFKYAIDAQTASTNFIEVTRQFSPSLLNSLLPSQFEGSERKFAFLINFADNIPTNASSTWQIDFVNLTDISFEFPGQNLSSLAEGVPHFRAEIENLLEDNWTLKVRVPSSNYQIRIFSIYLLVYDEIR